MISLIDANLIIRFFTNDDRKKADAVRVILKSEENFWLTDVTVSEIIWVLDSFYKTPKEKIVKQLESLISLPNIKCNSSCLLRALSIFKSNPLDWIDAYLISWGLENEIKNIYSFDQHFDKLKLLNRKEP